MTDAPKIIVTAIDVREARIKATDAAIAEITAQCNFMEASLAVTPNAEKIARLEDLVEETMERAAVTWAGYELVVRAYLKSESERVAKEIVTQVGENEWRVE